MRRCLLKLGLAQTCFIVLALLYAGTVQAAEVTCTVKYLSAEHVYLDAGLQVGLTVGQTGRVVRDGQAIGEVSVVFVAETSASCTASGEIKDIVAGDTVIFEVIEVAPSTTVVAPATRQRQRSVVGKTRTARNRTKPRLRGYLALQWDHGQESADRDLQTDVFRLPFRLQARNIWRGFDFTTRGSLRQMQRKGFSSSTPTSEWRNRVQELALIRDNRDLNWHFALGRIGGRVTNAAGPFDGLSVNRRLSSNTRLGVFGGFAPEWGNLGFGTDDHVLGANFHYNRQSENGRRLDLVLAGIGRYRSGEISREYLTMTTTWRGTQGLSLLQAAEVDFNRGWRGDDGAKSVALSSVALTGRYRISRQLSANLGYDNRDPVRTWETRSLPDSLFQDAGRTGWRAGLRWRPAGQLTVNLSGNLRQDERSDENITSWNARVNAPGLLAERLNVFASMRSFDGPWLSGWAPTVGLMKSSQSGYQLRAEGGYYSYTGNIDDSTRDNTWAMLGVSKDLTARLSVSAEYRQDWGDDIDGQRWFLELRRRF